MNRLSKILSSTPYIIIGLGLNIFAFGLDVMQHNNGMAALQAVCAFYLSYRLFSRPTK